MHEGYNFFWKSPFNPLMSSKSMCQNLFDTWLKPILNLDVIYIYSITIHYIDSYRHCVFIDQVKASLCPVYIILLILLLLL